MAQIFRRRTSIWFNQGIVLALGLFAMAGWAAYEIYYAPYRNEVDVILQQPVPFSHRHHTRGLGIDCRYCHTSVENSAFAGIPPTHTCMTCHSQIWSESEMLEPVRRSYIEGEPIRWNRVHDLPDFVYFNHSIHVQKGVSCVTCHGSVSLMPMTWKANPFEMEWCLDCHRDPARQLVPPEQIYDPERRGGSLSEQQRLQRGKTLMMHYGVETRGLTDCITCHR